MSLLILSCLHKNEMSRKLYDELDSLTGDKAMEWLYSGTSVIRTPLMRILS